MTKMKDSFEEKEREPENPPKEEGEKGDEKEPRDTEKKEEKSQESTEKESKDDKEKQAKDSEEEDENTKYMRLMADFQNYKKRCEKERNDIHAYANEKIVEQLLDVLDNFERGLEHDLDEGFKKGMEMIFSQLKEALTKSGVAEIPAEDQCFDPQVHNAVLMEDTNRVESGNVSQVLQKGYTLNGKVVRPAMVKVAK